MTIDAINAIREAESQAEVLCRVAAEKAAEMKQKIKAEGEAHLAKVREETTLEYQNELAAINARTARLRDRKHEEAEREAEELRALAHERMDEAVKSIVWGIIEKCQ